MRTVISVPGEAVQLPNKDHVKQSLGTVLYHALEVRAVIGLGGQGPVNIAANDSNIVFLAIRCTLPNLSLNDLLPLVVGKIASINYSFHSSFTPSIINRSSASFSLLFTGACGSKHISINSRISRFCSVFSLSAWGW